jgi:hypothetical protein
MLGIKPLLVGGFNPSEKYESQLGLLFSIYGKITKCSKPPTSILNIINRYLNMVKYLNINGDAKR